MVEKKFIKGLIKIDYIVLNANAYLHTYFHYIIIFM